VNPDVVVIGAGTAGSVVAGRLAERGDRQVLLVEAGPDYGVPGSGRWPAELLDASTLPITHDWGYRGPAADGRTITFDRARVVGGCSTHNGCTQSWGWSGDYDRWAASGLDGWSAAQLRPLFASATERMRVRRYADDEVQPFQIAFVAACEALGIPRRADLDDLDGGVGVDVSPVNVVDGMRWNASFGYVDPVRDNGYLEVWDHANVRRVVIESGRVTGVEVERSGERSVVPCGEVVLCAGAYGTPEILMRSGVGSISDVDAIGARPAVDLPGVGANLHDHPAVTLEFHASQRLAGELQAFEAEHGWLPEEQALAKLVSGVADGPYDLHVYPWVEPRPESPTGWAVVLPVGLVTPRSRGRLVVRGPAEQPVPDHAYLASDVDRSALVDGLELAMQMCASDEFAPLLGERCNPQRDGESLDDWMRRTHSHYWHPAGTARMGAADDGGVCDADGRVYGLEGLRVADASLFADIPRATPALPVVVAGERIATSIE